MHPCFFNISLVSNSTVFPLCFFSNSFNFFCLTVFNYFFGSGGTRGILDRTMDFQNCLIVPASKRSCETGRPPFLASGSRRRGAGSACSSGSRSKIKTQRARTQSRDRSSEVKRAVSETRGSKEQRQHAMTQRDRGPGLHMDEHERVREQCKGMTQKEESPSEDASGIAAASPCMWRLIQGGRRAGVSRAGTAAPASGGLGGGVHLNSSKQRCLQHVQAGRRRAPV